MSTPIRLGFMSFAHMHGASYARSARALPGVEIVGLWDDDPSRGQTWADRLSTTFFPEPARLLAEGLDGVIVCSENVKHAEHVQAAAGQTRGILCEKPISTSREDALAMIAACQQAGTQLQIAFPMRFSPPVMALKKQMEAEVLGEIYSATCTNHGSMPGGWFIEAALSGGGAVIDHTVHVIDLLRWLWNAEVTEVYAEVGDSLLHPGLGIDDVGLLSFQMSNGAFGTLDTSWSRPASYPTWGDVKLEILGERGLIRVDAFRQYLQVSSDHTGKTSWVHWGSDADRGLVHDFVDMLRTGRAPAITGEDGLRALEVALAAYESARTGAPVPLQAGQSAD